MAAAVPAGQVFSSNSNSFLCAWQIGFPAALRAIQNDADALKAAVDFERAAKTSLDLAQQQMASGNANFLYLLNAQIVYQNAILTRVQAQGTR